MAIGNLIKNARQKKGYSRDYMADKLGISYSAYANYENNKRKPDINTICDIANLLGVSFDFLALQTSFNDYEEYERELKKRAELLEKGTVSDFEKYFNLPKGSVLPPLSEEEAVEAEISYYLKFLNKRGQTEAAKRVEELTYIDKYTKKE